MFIFDDTYSGLKTWTYFLIEETWGDDTDAYAQ